MAKEKKKQLITGENKQKIKRTCEIRESGKNRTNKLDNIQPNSGKKNSPASQ